MLSSKDRSALSAIGDSADPDLAGRDSGIFKMQFMQRSIAAQQERAKAEKEALLKELSELDRTADSGDDEVRTFIYSLLLVANILK